ncbi:MAG: hypothetical protein JNK72_22475 [Myxococcales bacterium]|nr:hypothetical protein [Myxococcales bacterium]
MPLGSPTALVKLALLSHALAATVLTGAVTHLAVVVWAARRGRANPRLMKLYPAVALVAFGLTFALGALTYPIYRVSVRAAFLDQHAVWASVLFDLKENLAVLVAPLLVGAFALTRSAPRRPDPMLALCAWGAAAAVWFNLLAGLLVVSVRSV